VLLHAAFILAEENKSTVMASSGGMELRFLKQELHVLMVRSCHNHQRKCRTL